MKWNIGLSKSPEHKYSPNRSVEPKPSSMSSSQRNKKLLMSKSSMMGVLGVVPEERDSDDEDAPLHTIDINGAGPNYSKKVKKYIRNCSKQCNRAPAFNVWNIITQCLYILILLIYFFMIIDINEENIYSFNIIMVIFLFVILWFFTIVMFYKGCRTMFLIDFSLISILIITEIIEVVFRTEDDFDDNKDKTGIKFVINLNIVLRVIITYRRISDVIIQVNRRIYELIDYENKGPKELLIMLLKKLPPEESYIIVTIRRTIELMDQIKYTARRSRASHFLKSQPTQNGMILNTYQKDIKLENEHDIDKDIYDVVPDDEDIEKIFTWDEVGDDVRYSKLLSNIENLDFNIFELKSLSQGNELVLVVNHLMEINEFYEKLNIIQDKFRKYSVTIQKLYNPVSYHNKTHAADVAQTWYYFLTYWDFYNIGEISDMEACVMIISAMVHDTDHPGVNNLYLVNTRDKLALRYNDKSVLENHHIAVAFNTMLRSNETCIYENFSNDQFRNYRETMIDLVLATDNANHNTFIEELRKRQGSADFDPKNVDK